MLLLLASVERGLFARMARTRFGLGFRIGGAGGCRLSFSSLTRLQVGALRRVTCLDIRPLLCVPRRYRGDTAELLLRLGATPLNRSGVNIVLQRNGDLVAGE